MLNTDRLFVRQIIASFAAVGAKPPEAVTTAEQRMDRILKGRRTALSANADLPAAVAAALGAERDPATDPEVQRIVTLHALKGAGVEQGVEAFAIDQLTDELLSNTDAIVKAWTTPFDQAAAALTAAHQVLGPIALEDTAAVLNRGGRAAEAWSQAQAADATLRTIADAWVALASLRRLSALDNHYRVLRLAAVDAQTWLDRNLTEQRMTPWQIVCAGLTLSLPTPQQYREQVQALEVAAQERAAALAQSNLDRMTGRDPQLQRRLGRPAA